MENKRVCCPFCHTESKHGLGVCLPCGATITYGKPPGWAVVLGCFLTVVISLLICMAAQNFFLWWPFFIGGMIATFVIAKAAFKDRVIFSR
ncbi:TPA: hypothetical protein PXN30_004160 [Yersinia enterocolitica]|uniref:hypothetical protein n=1 Tax=Yersinia TaxID=629 RepID=UPI0005E46B98|nr:MULTISPECIES: hypothetical protein [Yersinia]EKN3682204.1 hypothetical protein [Yersinia enterocolitica]EKN4830603.1 hypothetical protein [Yersinia enterocolitica]EKN4853959.1 hypothetical protein [Yersinia enterocolitica]ELW8176979.1 hypothetical protein [Yersinia enterocolitica]CFR13209.1 Uncharacterised protein [Yersinia kristensenii]